MKNIYIYFILSLIVFASCGQSFEEKKRMSKAQRAELKRQDSLALKIAVMPTLDCLPLFIAKEKHLFDTLGVDVHLYQCNAQMDCDTLILKGVVEGSITDLVRAERIQKRGVALRYVATTNTYWQLITNRLGRIKELKQLSDKMIAITRYSATEYLADLAIDSVKPKYAVFHIQINDVHTRLKMLLNNEMDAVLLTEPQATTARIHKNPVLMDSRDKGISFGAFAFRSKTLNDKRRQQQLESFVKAYNMACDSLNAKGLLRYSSIIQKYCGADNNTIKSLPKMKFDHAQGPKTKDILCARNLK